MFSNKKNLSKAEMKTVYGDDIRKFRDEKCLTQAYVASELGIGQSAYQKIESGESSISMERLTDVAKILGISVELFIFKEQGIDNPSSESESLSLFVRITKTEYDMIQKTILQHEKRIEELTEKVSRKDKKIEALKAHLDSR